MLPSLERSHVETLLIALINDTAALPDHLVLVLDDYHTIEAQPVHAAVAFLLDHLPPQIHFYIATRSDPPLPIARLRGRGELNELRAADLRFSPDETSTLLKDVMGLEVTSDDVAELTARTEGWITGLQMAAFSMQDSQDIRGFIQAFRGSNRYILDYLLEEVLLRQPEDVQSFLVQTAILERLTGPLCAAVTGRTDSQAILDQLNRANLFLEPLGNEQRWYRYHRLFADLLQQRLRQMQPDLMPTLHRRASLWYQQNALIAEAIHHALSARDFDRAADLIEDAVQAIWARGEIATPLNWLKTFPDAVIRTRPLLCVYHATLLLLEGVTFSEVESRIEDAAKGDTAGRFGGELTVLRAILAMLRGDIQLGLQLSQQALPLLPEENLYRGLAIRNLSVLYLLTGDVATADTLLKRITGQKPAILARRGLYVVGSLYGARAASPGEGIIRALISVDSRGALAHCWPNTLSPG
jgi:LuxR family maltose regulon positive regulatory protein